MDVLCIYFYVFFSLHVFMCSSMYFFTCIYFFICLFIYLFIHMCIYVYIYTYNFCKRSRWIRAWCDFEGTSRRKLLQMCSQKCGLKDATVSRNIIRSCAFGRQTPNRKATRAPLPFCEAVFFIIFILPSVVQGGRCAWYRINSHLEKSDTSTKQFPGNRLSSRFRAILVPFLGRL
jgi:hypothetical protein